jgi:hypothetical protein
MIIYSPDTKTQMFIEYINSLLINENDEYKTWKIGDDIEINDKHEIVIFLQVVPNKCNQLILKNTKKINIFVCNTEQLTKHIDAFVFHILPFYEYIKNIDKIYFGLIDYSQQNINIIKKNEKITENKIEIFYIPYQYNKKEIDFLKSCSTGEKKIATCGCKTERRTKILNELISCHGIKVNNVIGFGNIRDKALMQHKILLNISAHDNFEIYEHIRCDRLIFSKMVIVSDHKNEEDQLDINKFIVWTDDNNFSDKLSDVLNNYDF